MSALVSGTARAGDFHDDTFAAVIESREIVDGYRLAAWPDTADGARAPTAVERSDRVCRIIVRVKHSYFRRGANPVFVEANSCERIVVGAEVFVRYVGLAAGYRFVGLWLDGKWYRLPRMWETTDASIAACAHGKLERVAGVACRDMFRARTL